MTYYDAGDNTQVFNSVWYPDPSYNLPVLGIDLLAFNRKKYLAIVDFQPLHNEEADHAQTYEHLLQPIKDKYDSLKGRMSSKFYDETQFFSKQMLFARFEDEGVVDNDLLPAFQQYVSTHVDLLKSTEADDALESQKAVLDRQKAYDTYSAERDPARSGPRISSSTSSSACPSARTSSSSLPCRAALLPVPPPARPVAAVATPLPTASRPTSSSPPLQPRRLSEPDDE